MSKCSLEITFDRPNRDYRGGETVRGTVRLQVKEPTKCSEIRLETYWKTHGYGNSDSGDKQSFTLMGGRLLEAGESIQWPFEFITPRRPLTYHGTLLNIDHYVAVIVDIPWGRNISLEEEFVLIPGELPEGFTGQRDKPTLLQLGTSTNASIFGMVIVAIAMAMLGVFLLAFSFILIPLFLLIASFFLVQQQMVRNRLGSVKLIMPHRVVTSAEEWPLTLKFTPKRRVKIDRISVTIQGYEECTFGSGTDKKTRRHSIYEVTHPLETALDLPKHKPFETHATLILPQTDAESFESGSNKVTWTAKVRISIVRSPDWVETHPLLMVPPEFVQSISADETATPTKPMSRPTTTVVSNQPITNLDEDADENLATDDQDASHEHDSEPASIESGQSETLVEVMAEIDQAERVASARQEVVNLYTDYIFACRVKVDRISSSSGQELEAYNEGFTILGTLADTGYQVRLFLLARRDATVTPIAENSIWEGEVQILKWDGLYNRPDLYEVV